MGIKTAILCGGMGTRMREQTEFMPKPLVSVGGMPILWHIMKIYSHFNFNDFVLCLGYKGEMIKDFFINYPWMVSDFTLHLKNKEGKIEHHNEILEDWRITFADTGIETNTAGRLYNAKKYLGDRFMMTYGDGVANINANDLLKYHEKHGKIATITCTTALSKYGHVVADNNIIKTFRQKPPLSDMINIGFAVFEKDIFKYYKGDCAIEDIFQQLIADNQLVMYKHTGAFHCMDTYKDYQDLNKIWESGAPWKVWS